MHYVREWRDGGPTDIDACGGDHRRIGEGGWQTRKQVDGRTEWIPPPALDAGGLRTNDYHHPERFLLDRSQDQPDPGGESVIPGCVVRVE